MAKANTSVLPAMGRGIPGKSAQTAVEAEKGNKNYGTTNMGHWTIGSKQRHCGQDGLDRTCGLAFENATIAQLSMSIELLATPTPLLGCEAPWTESGQRRFANGIDPWA
jgi:hypothetical protein